MSLTLTLLSRWQEMHQTFDHCEIITRISYQQLDSYALFGILVIIKLRYLFVFHTCITKEQSLEKFYFGKESKVGL